MDSGHLITDVIHHVVFKASQTDQSIFLLKTTRCHGSEHEISPARCATGQ